MAIAAVLAGRRRCCEQRAGDLFVYGEASPPRAS